MPKIILMTRAAVAACQPDHNAALIAIHNVGMTPVATQSGWTETLHLCFHEGDVSQTHLPVFSGAQAAAVLLFVARNAAVDTLVVACPEVGSRAAAIAKYFADKHDWPVFSAGHEVGPEDWELYEPHVIRFLYLADRQLERVNKLTACPAG